MKPVRPARAQPVGRHRRRGSAGLAAAEDLRKGDLAVTIYDRYDRAGGLLIYGIPNFKLEKTSSCAARSVSPSPASSSETGVAVGETIALDALRARHDAVLIATGVYKARPLDVPGADRAGVIAAMRYLTAANRKGLGDAVPDFDGGALDARGKRVVVIGGGDTAMDCVRTAIRQGAAGVVCLYRRDREHAGLDARGGERRGGGRPLQVPRRAEGDPRRRAGDGARSAADAARPADASGRRAPEAVPDGDFEIAADMVIAALGFDPEDLPVLFGAPDLGLTRWGTLKCDPRTMMTGLEGVFAAGDIVRGASLVVWAIRDGRDAAVQIAAYLDAGHGRQAAE